MNCERCGKKMGRLSPNQKYCNQICYREHQKEVQGSEDSKVKDIMKMVSEYYNTDLMDKDKADVKLIPRQVAAYLIRKHTRLTGPRTAQYMGVSNSTVDNGCKRIERLKRERIDIKQDVKRLEAMLEELGK